MLDLVLKIRSKMAGKKNTDFKKYIRGFWLIILSGVLAIFLLFFLTSLGDLPTFEELENPQTNLATEVISADGVTIGKYATENRLPQLRRVSCEL